MCYSEDLGSWIWPNIRVTSLGDITGNVHIEYRREDPGCGVAATMLHCVVAVFPA